MGKNKFVICVLETLFIFFFWGLGLFLLNGGYAQETDSAELVTLNYKDASVSSVLRTLSYSYDLNLVVTKDIKGKVTVSLKNVTIDEALEAILIVNGYAFTRRGNLIYITPGPGVEGIDLTTESIHLSYLTAAEAQRLLSKVISSKGDIQINEATNSLVVTDFPANIRKIEDVLEEIDVPPIQVLIEAKIIDIQSKAYENFGTTYTVTHAPVATNQGLFGRNVGMDESLVNTTTMAGPSSSLSGGQISITTIMKGLTVTATIDALIQQNKAHLLASPSIATLNGKEARIIIGERYPYKEKTQTTTGTTETTKFVDIGTTLRVTPQVSPDGWITMNIHPEVSSFYSALDAGPRITTREADTTVRVRDGQTIIIGGLIKKKDDRVRGGVPILKDIPILGWFFSKRSKDIEETELAVFITPHIIRTPEELAKKKDVVEEEVYLNLEGAGKLNLVAKLFEHARNLERSGSPESADKLKSHHKEAALNTYKQIVTQFPQAQNADFAIYKMGLLYYRYFKEYKAASEAFAKLIADYPDSRYRKRATSYLKEARKRQQEKEKRLERLDKERK